MFLPFRRLKNTYVTLVMKHIIESTLFKYLELQEKVKMNGSKRREFRALVMVNLSETTHCSILSFSTIVDKPFKYNVTSNSLCSSLKQKTECFCGMVLG
jgi:hypothetical protein